MHVFFLHKEGSQNPRNIIRKYNIIRFHPFFVIKDIIFFLIVFLLFDIVVFIQPYLLGDPENFSLANLISTPEHIVPEWYFLFAYAILRCVPSKGLGVVSMVLSIFLLLLPLFVQKRKSILFRKGKGFNLHDQSVMITFIVRMILLTWAGGQVVRPPFVLVSQLIFFVYLYIWCVLSL